MEWNQLEYFKTLAAVQHFTRAAEKLSLSQSALSRSIAKLEEEIGFPLFDRIGKQVTLNRYGKVFLQYVEKSLQTMAEGKQVIQDMAHPENGTITLAFMMSLGSPLISKLVSRYNTTYPNIQFKLYQNSTFNMLNELEAGNVDLCMCSLAMPRTSVEWFPLYEDELFAIMPHTHPLAGHSSVKLSEIAKYPLITYKPTYGLRVLTDSFFQQEGLKPHIAFEGEEILTIAGLVEANMGISLVPYNAALAHSTITFLPISKPKCYRTIAIGWAKDHYLSPAVEKFRDFVVSFVKSNTL